MANKRRRFIYGLVAVVVLLFVSSSSIASFYIDLLWFGEVAFEEVFWRVLGAKIAIGAVAGLVFAAILFANLYPAAMSLRRLPLGAALAALERFLRPRLLLGLAAGFSLFAGVLAGLAVSTDWQVVELYRHQTAWGVDDPIFGRDIGFYVFTLPVLQLGMQLLSVALVLSLLMVAGVYFVTGAIEFFAGRFTVHPRARLHIGFLIGALLVHKAGQYVLQAYALVHSPRGVAFGASYTDIHAQLPALRILAVIALLAAVAAVMAALRRSLRPLFYSVGGLLVASLLLGSAWPALMQRFIVEPNELVRERPFIGYNIEFTRRAFGLDRIAERDFPAESSLSWDTIQGNPGTIENIRLWDYRPLLQSYRGLQNLRPYYDFADVDVDRYVIAGQTRQVLLSARELRHDLLDAEARTWVNLHLKFTHGYGVVASPAFDVDQEGLPTFYLRDIPPVATAPELTVARPEIYFGELIDEFAIVKTLEPELDYPLGDENATTFYEGRGGIPIGPLLNRLAFALATQNYNLLFSTQLTAESMALIHRNVIDRVARIAPFLRYDRDPYIVIDDEGRLFWMLDAYSVTAAYPFSEPYRGQFAGPNLAMVNYVRNSVKVTVDAFHGDVKFYIFDAGDPIIATYQRVFPTLFNSADEMPEDLRRHVRYPEDLFRVQAEMLLVYHMTNTDTFYNKEDLWSLPLEQLAGEQVVMDPYYLIMQLPDEPEPEFLLMLPFTTANREDVMIGWLAARSDGDRYGELIGFAFPKQRLVPSPSLIEKRINQDPAIARDLALWNSQDLRVIRGNLLVIPIDESILYVEPLYLQSGDRGRPELKRVIAAMGSRLAMRETFTEALAAVLGERAPQGSGGERTDDGDLSVESGEWQELARRAQQLYLEALQMLQAGDFSGYAQRIEQLGTLLEQLAGEQLP